MKFLKNNSYDIVRLFINQIGITIFSLILFTSVDMIKTDGESLPLVIDVSISVLSTLFYFALLYTAAWDWGAKDKIRVDGGRMELDVYKGVKMSIAANFLNFVLAIGCVVFMGVYISNEAPLMNTLFFVFNLILRLISAMYIGILQGVFYFAKSNEYLYFFYQSIGYVIMPLFAVLATHLGYYFGLNDKRIFPSSKRKNTKYE